MDEYGISLGIPQTREVGAVGQKHQQNQQKDTQKRKKKKRKRKTLAAEDQAIIAGKTLSPNKSRKQSEEDIHPPDKGELIDIQV